MKTAFLIMFFLFPLLSHAVVFVEPSLGYNLGKFKQKWTHSDGSKFDYAGSANGIGLGFDLTSSYKLAYASLDLGYNKLNYKHKLTQITDYNGTNLTMGIKLGCFLSKMPIRFWLGYNFVDKLKFDFDTDADDITFSGSAIKFGTGAIVGKNKYKVGFNLEYIMHTYGNAKEKQSKASYSYDHTTSNNVTKKPMKYSSLLFTISVPFVVSK
jgi:hypothetical protein